MNKPRVLIVENSVDFTGGLNSILRSCCELKDSFDFTFVLPMGSLSAAFVKAQNLPVHFLPMKELRKNGIDLLLYFPRLLLNAIRLWTLLKQLKVDMILSNDFYNLMPSIYRLLGGKIPYVCYVRFRPSKFPVALVKFWCWFHNRYAAAVIAVSNIVKAELPSQLNVMVIGNEVPDSHFTFTPSSSTIVLYPANYIRGKGHEFALRSFAAISQKHPGWKLKFVGSDMGLDKNRLYKRELMQEAFGLGIAEAVEWGNFESDMSTQYQDAVIVLNFSDSESFSLTCLEAMFYGRPVVATKCGGPEEIIDDGDSGLLVELSDVAGMTNAIEELISNPAKRERLGRTAFEWVRKKYSYENTVGKLGALYNSVLESNSFNAR